jgi:hypothetical protein
MHDSFLASSPEGQFVNRASRERERQTRRTAYASTRQTAVPRRDTSYKRVWGDGSPAEQQAEIEYRRQHGGRDTAVHEAGQAVAAWLQGEKISHVMFNDRGSAHHDAQLDQCVAMSVTRGTH